MVKDYFVRMCFGFVYVCIPYGSNIVYPPVCHTQIFADLFSQSEWTLNRIRYSYDSVLQNPRAKPPPKKKTKKLKQWQEGTPV